MTTMIARLSDEALLSECPVDAPEDDPVTVRARQLLRVPLFARAAIDAWAQLQIHEGVYTLYNAYYYGVKMFDRNGIDYVRSQVAHYA